jgi:uncharacterized repeat protein (TIGR01451 family)
MSTKTSINNDVTTIAQPSDNSGAPLASTPPVTGSDIGGAKIIYVFDPPFGIKTAKYLGSDVVRWTMVWINDSEATANNVAIADEPPVGTTYQGNLVCKARGVSITLSCNYQAPTSSFPRGRILVTGNIAANPGVSDATLATNALEISFDNLVPSVLGEVSNQGTLQWNPNNDPNGGFKVLTGTKVKVEAPTKINLTLARTGSNNVAKILIAASSILLIVIVARPKRLEL